ncbi:MAG: hypothetical protein KBG70_12770, partial [Chitinophagales bacterium]|nr:hypothetical protein [Chitinophagales bacterium]
MSTSSEKARRLIELFSKIKPFDQVLNELVPFDELLSSDQRIPGPLNWSKEAQIERLEFIKNKTGKSLDTLSGKSELTDPHDLKGNIEQFIGMTQIPTGIIGPVRIHGTLAQGDFYVPMATTEGALVASYNRGARATALCGGIISVCLTEGVQRSPIFKFRSLSEVGVFLQWILQQLPVFTEIVSKTSRYAELQDMRLNMEGNTVVVIFEYTTGDAAGQNMVT